MQFSSIYLYYRIIYSMRSESIQQLYKPYASSFSYIRTASHNAIPYENPIRMAKCLGTYCVHELHVVQELGVSEGDVWKDKHTISANANANASSSSSSVIVNMPS